MMLSSPGVVSFAAARALVSSLMENLSLVALLLSDLSLMTAACSSSKRLRWARNASDRLLSLLACSYWSASRLARSRVSVISWPCSLINRPEILLLITRPEMRLTLSQTSLEVVCSDTPAQ